MLARSMQVSHSSLVAGLTPYNPALRLPWVQQLWNPHTTAGLAALNQAVTQQASMIAYIDDFKLMMIITLLSIPLILLLKRGNRGAGAGAGPVMD
jgi:DHA2 family multidrug resistance protein